MINYFYQGTTPKIDLYINEEHNVEDVDEIEVYFVQGVSYLKKELTDLETDTEKNCFYCILSVDETNLFSGTVINIEIRYKLKDDEIYYAVPIRPIRMYASIVGEQSYPIGEGGQEFIWKIMKETM